MKRLMICMLLVACAFAADGDRKRGRDLKRQAEITLRVIEATSDPKSANDAAALVPAELKKLLTFSRYRLLDSAFIRGEEDEPLRMGIAGSMTGVIRFEIEDGALRYNVRLEGPRSDKGDAPKLLETRANGKSGETLVLGASRMSTGNRAMIVILTGKLVQ